MNDSMLRYIFIKRMVHVNAVRALEDNFMYFVRKNANETASLVIDPVEPKKLIEFAKLHKLTIDGALITHHHWDHAGGTEDFRKIYKNSKIVPIICGDERINHVDHLVKDQEVINLAGLTIKCLSTPCHTKGHICYHITDDSTSSGVVITGDTLFIAGCGKFFEGTAAEMHKNLNETLSSLPNDTLVYPGHEYTITNLKFAQYIEPSNQLIEQKLKWAIETRENDKNTIPSTIGEEKQINPFMRVSTSKEIQDKIQTTNPIEGMRLLREAKNSFKATL